MSLLKIIFGKRSKQEKPEREKSKQELREREQRLRLRYYRDQEVRLQEIRGIQQRKEEMTIRQQHIRHQQRTEQTRAQVWMEKQQQMKKQRQREQLQRQIEWKWNYSHSADEFRHWDGWNRDKLGEQVQDRCLERFGCFDDHVHDEKDGVDTTTPTIICFDTDSSV